MFQLLLAFQMLLSSSLEGILTSYFKS